MNIKDRIKRDVRNLNIKQIVNNGNVRHIFTRNSKEFIFVKERNRWILTTVIKRSRNNNYEAIEKRKMISKRMAAFV
ncbi:hypothetical protein [Bacillus sp. Bos-x628]|uniref:hypothetical protein n=1 Tax=Bacillus maqinnsis TaxID=3229854 RepID=UPI00338DA7CE